MDGGNGPPTTTGISGLERAERWGSASTAGCLPLQVFTLTAVCSGAAGETSFHNSLNRAREGT